LKDLHEENNFAGYISYIEDVKGCLHSRIINYTVSYCDEKLPNSTTTNLQATATDEVSRLIDIIDLVLSSVNSSDIRSWLTIFCSDSNFRKELAIELKIDNLLGYNDDVLEELNLINFKDKLVDELYKLKTKCQNFFLNVDCDKEMKHWKDQPQELLSDLIGCTEQCPFCMEQCDLLENHDCDHRTEVHRISCLAGWRSVATQEMTTDICPVLIASEDRMFKNPEGEFQHYKDYKKVYQNWSIPPNKSPKSCTYWMSFVDEYKDELAEHFNAKASNIPSDWSSITWPNIKECLNSAYNV